MRATEIRTEYLKDPIGIDFKSPRIFWNCEGGVKQTAYQIVSDQWDSGKVESERMHAAYPLPLAAGERVSFRIRLWDENGAEGEWSEPAFFETGIGGWQALYPAALCFHLADHAFSS